MSDFYYKYNFSSYYLLSQHVPQNQFSNLDINLSLQQLHYVSSRISVQLSDSYIKHQYQANSIKFFRFSQYKKWQVYVSGYIHTSSSCVDRSSIFFNNVKSRLELQYKHRNIYYYNNLNNKVQQQIFEYSKSKFYNQYNDIHPYEQKNRIYLPEFINPKQPRIKVPDTLVQHHLREFIHDTADYVLSVPAAPSTLDPFDIKYCSVLQPGLEQCYLYPDSPPVVQYIDVVTNIESQFPNKKYLHYDRYKNMVCHYCKKKGHPARLCEEIVDISSIEDPAVKRLAQFVADYPLCSINPVGGEYSDILLTLPQEYGRLQTRHDKFWLDYGFDNPFADTSKYWSFGDYRRRDIGWLWALGASRVYLLKLIIGYESKLCINIPRMKLNNHQSWDTNVHLALPVLCEYIQFGILKLVPATFAEVILPMSVVVKPNKIRIVIDGKPINSYTPSMKFKPDTIQQVSRVLFKNALTQGADALHAFYQLPVTTSQARKQCIQFIHPVTGQVITAAFFTEIFGSKLSCYRYVKMEDNINKYFKLMGIKFNSFYDDAAFYSLNNSLHAAVMGSFIKRVYHNIGRQLNEGKTDLLRGSYKWKFCGFRWNSQLMVYRPLQKLEDSSRQYIRYIISRENFYIPIKWLVKVMGKLMYMGYAYSYMSILLSPIKDLLRKYHSKYSQDEIWERKFKVPTYLCNQLEYLHGIIDDGIVMPIQIPDIQVEIVTDTSDRLSGSFDSTGKSIVVPLPDYIKCESSTLRECYGILVALYNRIPLVAGKRVRVLIDNLGTSTILMRNGSKLKKLNAIVYSIIRLCVKYKIYLWTKWLRRDTEQIRWADDLSKSIEKDRWIFDPSLVYYFIHSLKLPDIEVDLLADDSNKLVDVYYSRYYDGKSRGFNWLQESADALRGKQCYLNPPFRGDYLQLSVEQIIKCKINTYIILPLWPNSVWYNMVMDYASVIIILNDGNNYFESPSYMTARNSKTWRLMFVYFDFTLITPVLRRYIYQPQMHTLQQLA